MNQNNSKISPIIRIQCTDMGDGRGFASTPAVVTIARQCQAEPPNEMQLSVLQGAKGRHQNFWEEGVPDW